MADNVTPLKAAAKAVDKEPTDTAMFTAKEDGSVHSHAVARDQLRAFVERIERLEEEKATVATDIKEVYGEVKAMGYSAKIVRRVISIRKKDHDDFMEEEAILDTYLTALGMGRD